MSLPDLFRLLALPIFALAAKMDFGTRRVPSRIWHIPILLGILLIAWDWMIISSESILSRFYLIRVLLSIVLVGGLGYGFHYMGVMGKADAKGILVISILFPVYPSYSIWGSRLPIVQAPHGIFSLSALVDGALIGIFIPTFLYIINALNGRFSLKGFFYYPIGINKLMSSNGSMYVGEPPTGSTIDKIYYYISMLNPQKDRLDLDAFRMYLRWRGTALEDILQFPDEYRHPNSLPNEYNSPTDGVVNKELDPSSTGHCPMNCDQSEIEDPWGAEEFIKSVGNVYGTTPQQLRAALNLACTKEKVWITPGLPMLVSIVIGLFVALVYGDILYSLYATIGFL